MASCKCGGGACNCVVTAGPGTTVTGSGSASTPYIVGADVSKTPGNTLTIDSDGLYVPAPVAGCGLTGDGTAAEPLAANTQEWPYSCPVDANGGGVYCDPVSGELHTDPPVRYNYFNFAINELQATPIAVPTVPEQEIRTISLTVTNTDPCRPAYGILFREVDLDFDLPPNSGAMAGFDGDDMNYLGNTGNGTVFNTHSQDNKINEIALAPGETRTITLSIQSGRGSGGATITRIQATLRVWLWSNQKAEGSRHG
ncbi:hypothetical protein ACFY2T_41375 [Streptomyces sp. NPDC001260]|uniref:hypothetical protein n=1 Tax=Streptomyces sp. NPDC001260 TaxID=3364551 RepID=UPI00369864C5